MGKQKTCPYINRQQITDQILSNTNHTANTLECSQSHTQLRHRTGTYTGKDNLAADYLSIIHKLEREAQAKHPLTFTDARNQNEDTSRYTGQLNQLYEQLRR